MLTGSLKTKSGSRSSETVIYAARLSFDRVTTLDFEAAA
jgi:hypothetical protein